MKKSVCLHCKKPIESVHGDWAHTSFIDETHPAENGCPLCEGVELVEAISPATIPFLVPCPRCCSDGPCYLRPAMR